MSGIVCHGQTHHESADSSIRARERLPPQVDVLGALIFAGGLLLAGIALLAGRSRAA
jgi:hypothetical protein